MWALAFILCSYSIRALASRKDLNPHIGSSFCDNLAYQVYKPAKSLQR